MHGLVSRCCGGKETTMDSLTMHVKIEFRCSSSKRYLT